MQEGLYAIVGSAGRGALEANYRLDDAAPFAVVAPASESEVCALLDYTYAMRTPCLVTGSGTHLTHLVPPDRAWWLLCTRRLSRVVDYSPQDLVLTVGAGMTLHAVQELLREHRQYLPWNPALPQQATLGGVVSSNRAGSWRYRFGTPRDRLLAVRAVTPDGVAFKSGAKVVKSVAGYDLHRLLCGAWGTLAVITEITLKVQPLPQHFEAVGWQTTWDALEPTLADLMQMPLQPDGISVLAMRNHDVGVWQVHKVAQVGDSIPTTRSEFVAPLLKVPPASRGEPRGGSISPTLRGKPNRGSVPPARRGNLKEGVVIPPALPEFTFAPLRRFPPLCEGNRARVGSPRFARGTAQGLVPHARRGNLKEGVVRDCYARSTLLEPPPAVAPLTQSELQTEPRLQTEQDAPVPYLLLEFSGSPEGVAWQIAQLRERGYPAEPVPDATLQQVRDWLTPRRHALLLQILLRPSEIADAMARWSELRGVSALAHAGNGVLYVAADESGLTDALLQRVRALTAKYRVLSGAGWLREQSGGELPKLALSDGERRLMQRLKAALDERGILPDLISR
jgi:FAD/FMN-containing dehydrogenase